MVDGRPGMYDTRVAALWDDENRYVAFVAEEPFVTAHQKLLPWTGLTLLANGRSLPPRPGDEWTMFLGRFQKLTSAAPEFDDHAQPEHAVPHTGCTPSRSRGSPRQDPSLSLRPCGNQRGAAERPEGSRTLEGSVRALR